MGFKRCMDEQLGAFIGVHVMVRTVVLGGKMFVTHLKLLSDLLKFLESHRKLDEV